jgi:PAB1-binding protein PBP1
MGKGLSNDGIKREDLLTGFHRKDIRMNAHSWQDNKENQDNPVRRVLWQVNG